MKNKNIAPENFAPITLSSSTELPTQPDLQGSVKRRSFLKNIGMAGAAISASALLGNKATADVSRKSAAITTGDAAILQFLSALEIIEGDFWQQYNELCGIQDSEVPGGSGNPIYTAALAVLDVDMAQYVHDNTENEMSHAAFINAYLLSKGVAAVNLDQFRTLPSSQATGAQQIGRLTNLMQLTVDTSFWTRYRSREHNPDLDPHFIFPQAVPSLFAGQFPAIPRNDDDLHPHEHIQAIANTAGFHFVAIEQGGSSIYPSLAQRVTDVEVLRILLSIGPTETAHYQTWLDKAGNAPPLTDPTKPELVFPDLNAPPFGGQDFQTNLIMPEPCPFLSRKFPPCSIIRPTETKGAARAAVRHLTAAGAFIGQTQGFFDALSDLASDADAARRGF